MSSTPSDPSWPNWTDYAPAAWDGGETDTLTCTHIVDETHDVKTFIFAGTKPRHFRFLPGQFMTFIFGISGQEVQRCYTIASPPTRPDRIAITVKRVPGGVVSNWLHNSLLVGTIVQAHGPMGDFTCFSKSSVKYLFLSAGSGLTPLMSMARALMDLAWAADVIFVHSARTPRDIIFHYELMNMSRRNALFRFVPICGANGEHTPWFGYRGRLTSSLLAHLAPDFRQRACYTCGPTSYMRSIRNGLSETDYDMINYHEESFVPLEQSRLSAHDTVEASEFRIYLATTGQTVLCAPDQTVLDSLRQAGLKVPFSCTRGLCGTCKTNMSSGKVDMRHAGGIRQREVDRGQILICCSKPLTDLVIER